MISQAIVAATFVAAIGCGLVAGIFFAFSSFIMGALGRMPPEQGIHAMRSINVVVINRSFLLVFFGTAALCGALLLGAWFRWDTVGGKLLLPAGLLYLAGVVGVTMLRNVPLNDALAAVQPASAEAAALWARYLDRWTFWNTVRTVAPTMAMALYVAALMWGG